MARKDASGQHFTPVDHYRKQIGKHDWKKSRKEIKAMKTRADEGSQLTAQNIVLMVGLSIAIFSLLYVILFWHLGMGKLDDDEKDRAPV